MSLMTEKEAAPQAAVADRRRPGRIENVNPALIPLLRRGELPPKLEGEPDLTELLASDERDQVAGARGLATGLVLSAPLWVGIYCLGRWLLS